MKNQYDIIILGAGPSGICAAIQAAQTGASTLLIEKNGVCGGTTVSAGVDFIGLFHAWGKQVISGIGWDIVVKTIKESGGVFPDYSNFIRPHWKLHTHLNPYIYASIAEETVIDSGAEILYHTLLASVEWQKEKWNLQICGKEGLKNVSAKVLIDCTGDANASALAGFETKHQPVLQPASLIFHCSGYNIENLNFDSIQRNFKDAVLKGKVKWSDIGGQSDWAIKVFLELGGKERNHIPKIDATTSGKFCI